MLAPIALRGLTLDWSRVYVMGVVNVTPDSFSDGGALADADAAIARALALLAAGADVVDIGGESTRPGATPVPADVEIARVVPVIRGLRARTDAPISVDTTKAAVARAALDAGADVVNDISGGRFDPELPAVAARAGAYICGHVRGDDLAAVHAAEAMTSGSPAAVASQIADELVERVAALPAAVRAQTIVDPCLGFGKDAAVNLALCRNAGAIAARVGRPILLGPSRKRFVGALVGGAPPGDPRRDAGTVGAALASVTYGAHMLRVHHVEWMVSALAVYRAVATAGQVA